MADTAGGKLRLDPDDATFRRLVEQSADYAVFVLDPDGCICSWNRGAERIKGYRADEIVGSHFSRFYTPEAVASGWPVRELEIARRMGRLEDEGWRVRKDGTRFWANVIITPIVGDDGEVIGFSKFTRDLTARRQQEEELRQSEERFRLLVEGVTDYAIYMLDTRGIITSWNAGAERITGYARDEVIGTPFSRFYTPEEGEGAPAQELADALRSGRTEREGWRLTKSGRRFRARVVVTALHDGQGVHRGFAKVTQDLTERQHVLALEQAATRVADFISVLAHELRNPLAPIRNAVEILGRAGAADERTTALHGILDRQSGQLVRIVDDMLDLARISKGMLAIARERVELSDVVRRAVESVAGLVAAKGHRLTVEEPAGPVVVDGDVNRLTQLLVNLLNNAARYTPRGGTITIALRRDGDVAELGVRDSGRGIDPASIERMFDMYVRETRDQERNDGGLGIGLALARKIAELHGGTLEGFSEGRDKGAEFVLRMPAAATPADDDADAGRAAGAARAAGRVMVVDDNADAAAMLGELARMLGHTVLVVSSGREALDAFDRFRPDALLLDLGMPGMSGIELATRLRADGRRRVRLVAVTGWGHDAHREATRIAGFDHHLVKPASAEAVSLALRDLRGAESDARAVVR